MKKWLTLAIALMFLATALAEGAVRELSEYFGGDIAEAAEALGGLTYAEGVEFKENYTSDGIALRGADGKVTFIELKEASEGDALCGVSVGMARKDVAALMEGKAKLWEYDEEIAWIVRADQEDQLNSETLVVFFDEKGKVNGVWYRTSRV